VFDNALRGTAHSGLALGMRCTVAAAGVDCAGTARTAGIEVVAERTSSVRSASIGSGLAAEVRATAPFADNVSISTQIENRRFIFCPDVEWNLQPGV
jgi:hypothetical protein